MNDLTRTTTLLLDGLRDPANHLAWTQLHERCRPLIVAYARRRGLQDADVDDVVQECLSDFVTAYRNGQYDRTLGRLRQWMSGFVARRVAKALSRRRRHGGPLEVQDRSTVLNQLADDPEHEQVWEEEWQKHVLALCREQIHREFDQRQCLMFEQYALQGRPVEEVAAELGVTPNAIYICKNRILSRLRQLQAELAEIW